MNYAIFTASDKRIKVGLAGEGTFQRIKSRTKEIIKDKEWWDKKQTAVEEMEGTVPYAHSRNNLHFYFQLHSYVWSDNSI